MKKLLLIPILFPVSVSGQFSLKGIIKDSVTNQSIQYATIYENGTTNGTISNSEGKFQLYIESANCEMIFSYVGYESKKWTFHKPAKEKITIQLVPRVVDLQTVDIVNSDLRKKNVEIFEKCFLGYDYWGENAILENANALTFMPEYFPNQIKTDTLRLKEIKKPKKRMPGFRK
ncbi:MAG: carboxypeptidase-like regulatory domain-containing protein [Prolixibacteraceae bacterium]|nr:carboxypeptidase-like regulatory domain-containing protein [Prolixibacteraceae bacterium]